MAGEESSFATVSPRLFHALPDCFLLGFLLEPALFPTPFFLGFTELREEQATAFPALLAFLESGKSPPGTPELAGAFGLVGRP